MQKIIPNIWCNGTAEEAGRFYADALPGGVAQVTSRYPTEGLLDFQEPLAGQALTVDVTIGDFRFTLINAGPEFRPNPSISFMVNFDPLMFDGDPAAARDALDAVWAHLSDGGEVLMPLQEYPFSQRYGWVQDRFGFTWQLTLTDPTGDPRPFIIPSLTFVGRSDGRAREAVERYTSLFPDAAVGTVMPYPGEQRVMFSEFRIGDQWFTAMDGGATDHEWFFDCGVSLEVRCADQAEIDTYWDALSAVPEAEQCGWLADEFGVSWQIVPENMGELMQRPDAFAHMLQMKKLVIADF